jgi:hypothetical protein
MKTIAVLFARSDSIYKTFPDCDVWDIERDARRWPSGAPVVAHPPCRAWGSLRKLAKPRPDEKELALWAVDQVRQFGGVLEHPAASKLWEEKPLPRPGEIDAWGGWTLPITQNWFGHRAEKKTLLYICGCRPADVPAMPLVLGEASHIITANGRRKDGSRRRKGDLGWRPECTKAEREHTPPILAEWLRQLAAQCKGQ